MRTTQTRSVRSRAHKLTAVALIAVIAVALAPLGGAQRSASAGPPENAVLDWNQHAVTTFLNAATAPTPGAGQPPQVAIQHIAMVQGAMYDAVNMIDGSYQPYLEGLPAAPPWASKSAAAATAAHHVLVGVVIDPPLSQAIIDRLDGLLAESIAAATSASGPDAVAAGIAAGESAAAAMLAAREDDGRYEPYTLTSGTEPGQWRPELPSFVSDPFAWLAFVDPFTLESAEQFRTKGPLALTSGLYTKEYNEVKELGGATGSARTPEQEAIAQFYSANPVEMFNRMFRTLSEAEGLTLVEEARLFAMLNLAVADSLITCTSEKVYWGFWRPITAIHEGNNDGNPHTVGDPNWMPLFPTPPYSDHTSGYNCVTGAFMHTAEAFFGTNWMNFSVVKIAPNVPNVTRDYQRFTDVVNDTIDARVYQGLHFRTADVQGAEIGENVANWLSTNYFQPMGKTKHKRVALAAQLSGANEVPPGDADSFGFARLTLDEVSNEICYQVNVAHIAPATAAHIHRGTAGANGPVVIPLKTPGGNGMVKGCVEVDAAVIAEIQDDPSGFYVNVHTEGYPGGAVRGQLQHQGGKTR